MGAEPAATLVSVKANRKYRRVKTHRGDARMPLSPEAQTILRALSEPIDQRRRSDFMAEAERRIETASAESAIGPGLAHRIGRATQRDYFDPPVDLRQNRVGPRGPRG
jgi:hypothetical protein